MKGMATKTSPMTSARNASPTFHLTRAKRDALEFLAEFFCLRVSDLAKLSRNREPNENDLRTARRTLLLLSREGSVNRLPYFDLQTEGKSYVYGLSDRAVAQYGGKTFDEHSQRTLDHELEITQFHIRLKRFAAKHGLKLYWQQSDLKRTIHPDALFALTDPKKPEGKNTFYFFLETERAKIGHYRDGKPSIITKLQKYYDYFDSDKCRKEWAFKQFRVIVVQRNEERSENLLPLLQKHRMFWLTDEPRYKRGVDDYIFRTPKDWTERTYGFLDIFND